MTISIDDIKDEDSLTAWLNERPEAVRQNCAVFIAARSALRVLPIAVEGLQFSDWSRKRDLTAIACVSGAFISSVAAKLPTDDMRNAALRPARRAATAAVWRNVRADCVVWVNHAAADGTCGIDVAPLIDGEFNISPDWPVVREKLLNDNDPKRGADWSFWIEWYDNILRGDPQDWDMLYEIAVSQDIDWEATSREVNAAIARIVEKHRLLREIAHLKAQRHQLVSLTASAEMRSHNMPPELVDDEAWVTQSIQIIWDTMDEAEEELREEKPEPSRLKYLGEVLLKATAEVIIRYCGPKADIMVTAFAKAIGTTAGVAAAGWLITQLATQAEVARKIGNGLVEFAKPLLGG